MSSAEVTVSWHVPEKLDSKLVEQVLEGPDAGVDTIIDGIHCNVFRAVDGTIVAQPATEHDVLPMRFDAIGQRLGVAPSTTDVSGKQVAA